MNSNLTLPENIPDVDENNIFITTVDEMNGGNITPRTQKIIYYYKDIEVITPLFGGGTEIGTVDKVHPIRASSIRGHLRFWWRVLYGSDYSTPEEMFQYEEQIFGSSKVKSPVKIIVNVNENERNDFLKPHSHHEYPKYIMFPYRSIEAKGLSNLKFDLKIVVDCNLFNKFRSMQLQNLLLQLYNSLVLWINFGGIGARTRRGCGSLFQKELSFKDKTGLNRFLKNNDFINEETPKFKCRIGFRPGSPVKMWKNCSDTLEKYRRDND